MKTCKTCGVEKPLSEYGKKKGTSDGYRIHCKPCTNKINKEICSRDYLPDDVDLLTQPTDKWNGSVASCANCGGLFQTKRGRAKITKYCCDECTSQGQYDNLEPIKKKATVLGANLLMGKGKLAYLMELVSKAIGTKCVYCGVVLALENLSIDHKEAYGSSKARRNKAENRKTREVMDRKDNLHVVCQKCNSLKNDIDHNDYLDLLDYFKTHPKAEKSIVRRLKMANAPFGSCK